MTDADVLWREGKPFPDPIILCEAPCECGAVVEIAAKDETGHVVVAGAMWMTPAGLVGGLDLPRREEAALDDYETYKLDVLIARCCEGGWTLRGLRNCTPDGTYAKALVMDAVAAMTGAA